MKRSVAIVTLVILALAAPVLMSAQQNSKAEKEIRALIDELEPINVKGGAEAAAALDKMFADEWIRIAPNGAVFTKADILDGFRTGKIKVEKFTSRDVKIHIYGNTAVVTGIEDAKATMMGADYRGTTRWTRVFVKRGGKWENVLFQSTRIAEPAKQ